MTASFPSTTVSICKGLKAG